MSERIIHQNEDERAYLLKRLLQLLRLGVGMFAPFFKPDSLLRVRSLVFDGIFSCSFHFLIKWKR